MSNASFTGSQLRCSLSRSGRGSPQVHDATLVAFHSSAGGRMCLPRFLPRNRYFISLFLHANKKCCSVRHLLGSSCDACRACHLRDHNVVISEVVISITDARHMRHSLPFKRRRKKESAQNWVFGPLSWHLVKQALVCHVLTFKRTTLRVRKGQTTLACVVCFIIMSMSCASGTVTIEDIT